jgi:hypothetical protein
MFCLLSVALLVCVHLGQAARPAMEQVGSLTDMTHGITISIGKPIGKEGGQLISR